jgi:uncharacterized delta-60 repeat protein
MRSRVVAGTAAEPGGLAVFAVARLNGDGSADGGFGTAGKVTIGFPGDVVTNLAVVPSHGLVLQADGKILVAATTVYADGSGDFAVARLNGNGSADGGFSAAGEATIHFPGASDLNVCSAMVLQPDGKILLAGTTFNLNPGQTELALARLNPNGNPDTSFGTAGETTVDFGGFDLLYAVTLRPGGKIVAAGTTNLTDFAVARLNPDGRLDTGFGTGGETTISFGAGGLDFICSLLVQPDGKMVIAGSDFNPVNGNEDFALARLNPNGGPDASFGTGGRVTTGFNGGADLLTGLVLLPGGNMLAAGLTFDCRTFNVSIALAEYAGR